MSLTQVLGDQQQKQSISVKEVKGEDEHDGELGQLLQQLPGGDARMVRSFTEIIKSLLHLLNSET